MTCTLIAIFPILLGVLCLFLIWKNRNEPDPAYFDSAELFKNYVPDPMTQQYTTETTLTSTRRIANKHKHYIPRYIRGRK